MLLERGWNRTTQYQLYATGTEKVVFRLPQCTWKLDRFQHYVLTRLPFNVRQTSHKCLYFRSRDKNCGHTIWCAVAETSWYTPTLRPRFFAPVTLTLTRWLSYTNSTRIPYRCTRGPKMNFLCQGFQTLLYHRQTDRCHQNFITPLRGW